MQRKALTPLQAELLDAFFRHDPRFILTGGAALAGFYLGHRQTNDLDLFAAADVLDDGDRAVAQAAESLGGRVEQIVQKPGFHRSIVWRGVESVVVDLVHDAAPKSGIPPRSFGAIRVDDPMEILANKLCTLLSRSELRDLVDVQGLESMGLRVEDALAIARMKDAGMSAPLLAWVLSQIRIGDQARLPGGIEPAELRKYVAQLGQRLLALGFPRT